MTFFPKFAECDCCDELFFSFELENVFGARLCPSCKSDFLEDHPEFKFEELVAEAEYREER